MLPFSRKGQTEEKLHERKELFSLRDDYEYREEYTEEEEEEKERKDDAREESFVVVAETERLKSSDRPRCGPGIGVASRGYFKYLSARIFMHFSSSDKKNSHENRAKNHLTFLLE